MEGDLPNLVRGDRSIDRSIVEDEPSRTRRDGKDVHDDDDDARGDDDAATREDERERRDASDGRGRRGGEVEVVVDRRAAESRGEPGTARARARDEWRRDRTADGIGGSRARWIDGTVSIDV